MGSASTPSQGLGYTLSMHKLFQSSPCTVPISQVREVRQREVKQLAEIVKLDFNYVHSTIPVSQQADYQRHSPSKVGIPEMEMPEGESHKKRETDICNSSPKKDH